MKQFDSKLVAEYRRHTKNKKSSQEKHIIQPAEAGGLGIKRLSIIIQGKKKIRVNSSQDATRMARFAIDFLCCVAQKNSSHSRRHIPRWSSGVPACYSRPTKQAIIVTPLLPLSPLSLIHLYLSRSHFPPKRPQLGWRSIRYFFVINRKLYSE